MKNKIFRKLTMFTAAIAVTFTTAFAVFPQAKAEAASYIIPNGWYYIKNINSQLYLEVKDGNDKDGANVQQWTGNGADCQKWYVSNVGSNYITLKSGMKSGRMLDTADGGTANGTNIRIWKANNLDPQKFKVVKSSNGAVCLKTKCSKNKQAIDVYNWSKKAGGNIDTWEYNGLACQQFKFEAVNGSNSSDNNGSKNNNSGSNSGNSGSSSTSGTTINVPANATLENAVKQAKSGTTIVISGTVKSGSINLPSGVNISGKNNAVIDFSSTSGSNGRGITLAGNGSTISNITVKNAADNGLYITGSNNTFKYVESCYNEDAGFQVCNGGSYNKFYNCHSHHNADAKGENADGFANKLHSGAGNYYESCIADYNSDDGWDLYAAHGAVTLVNCQANYNGLCNGIYGDGNGFKMGGVDNKTPGQKAHLDPLNHTLTGCSAKGNYAAGFDRNNQSGVVTMTNCISDSNKTYNYNWPLTGTPSALGYKVTFGKAKIVSCTSKNGKNRIDGATLSGKCVGF